MSENDTKNTSNNSTNNSNNNNNSNNSGSGSSTTNDRIEWSRSTILGFIEDYRRQRVLWDPNTKGYHIKQTKYEALKALGQKYSTEIRSIRSKIKSLRSSFHREHGKVMNGRRRGIHYQPMWFAYEAIRFILIGDGNNANSANSANNANNATTTIDTKNIPNNNNIDCNTALDNNNEPAITKTPAKPKSIDSLSTSNTHANSNNNNKSNTTPNKAEKPKHFAHSTNLQNGDGLSNGVGNNQALIIKTDIEANEDNNNDNGANYGVSGVVKRDSIAEYKKANLDPEDNEKGSESSDAERDTDNNNSLNNNEDDDDDDDDSDAEELKLFISNGNPNSSSTNNNTSNIGSNSQHNHNHNMNARSSSAASTPTMQQQNYHINNINNNNNNSKNNFSLKTEMNENGCDTANPNILNDKKSPSLHRYQKLENDQFLAHCNNLTNTINRLNNVASLPIDGFDYATKMAYFISNEINNGNLPNPLLALTNKIENDAINNNDIKNINNNLKNINNNNNNNNNNNLKNKNQNNNNNNHLKNNNNNNSNNNNNLLLANGLLGAAGTAYIPAVNHFEHFIGFTGAAANSNDNANSNSNNVSGLSNCSSSSVSVGSGSAGSVNACVVDDRSMARVTAVIAAAKAAAKANNNNTNAPCSLTQSADVIGNAVANADLDGDLQPYCNIRAEDVKTEIIENEATDMHLPDGNNRHQTPSPSPLPLPLPLSSAIPIFYNIKNSPLNSPTSSNSNNCSSSSTSNNSNNRPTDLSANSSRKRKAVATRYDRYTYNSFNDDLPSPSKQIQQHIGQLQQHSNNLNIKAQTNLCLAAAAGRELTNAANATTLIPTSLQRQTPTLNSANNKTLNNCTSSNNNNSNSNTNKLTKNEINAKNSNHLKDEQRPPTTSSSNSQNDSQPQHQHQHQQQQQHLQDQQVDEYGIFGEYVAVTIRKLKSAKAKIVVKHLINNLLYEAELGKYDQGMPATKDPPQLYKM